MVEINLLPWRAQRRRQRQNNQRWEFVLAFLLAFLLLTSVHFILLQQVQIVNARLSRTESGLAMVNKNLQALQLLYQELDYQKLPDFNVNTIFIRQRQILRFLRTLTAGIPREVYVQHLQYNEQGWVIEGVSPLLADILLFSERLNHKGKDHREESVLKKEKGVHITQKRALFYYQFRFESGL